MDHGRIRRLCSAASAVAILAVIALAPASPALAKDDLIRPRATDAGTFAGIRYIQYDGIIRGQTSTGAYRVPYRITAPADPSRGNHTVLVEPPHAIAGLGVVDRYLLPELFYGKGFTHAGIGYSTARFGKDGNLRILDPAAPHTFVRGGTAERQGRTDPEIIADFAHALSSDRDARTILGHLDRRYVSGFSEASGPILELVTSGAAPHVFDLAIPLLAGTRVDPQPALADGRFDGKLLIFNSQWDGTEGIVDDGTVSHRYRVQVVAGAPHVADTLVPFFSAMTTPANWQPVFRAGFLEADRWVRKGTEPPPSTELKRSGGEVVSDSNGNAITVDSRGRKVPRLPIIELGEARFKSGFLGTYKNVKTVAELGFAGSDAYLAAFKAKLRDFQAAGYMLGRDAREMRRRAALCPGLTFTEAYRDHYDEFVGLDRCR